MIIQQQERAGEFKRNEMMQKLQEDNLRSQKIKAERAELMKNRAELRRQIDGDKQRILQDFEALKQGKLKSEEIADKYGYAMKSQDGGEDMNQSQVSKTSSKKKSAMKSKSRLCKTPPLG